MSTTESCKTVELEGVFKGRRICLLAPYPPRKGGVTVQTDLIATALKREGADLIRVDTNLHKLRIPIIGTPIRLLVQPWVVAWRLLWALPKCEVIHIQAAANWGYLPAVIGAPMARLFRRRSVMSFHSGIGPQFMDRFPWLVKMPFRLVTVPVVCSPELQVAFRERGIEAEFHRNLFEPELYRFRERIAIKPNIIWNRSFEELYDPFSAIKAFELIKKQYPDATLLMTSDGPLMPAIKDYVKSRGITGVTMPGRIPKEDLAKAMNDADIQLNTTIADGLPTSLLEAGASGLAIVTTNAGGIAFLLGHEESAMLVGVRDYEAMADAIIHLLEHPDRAQAMGRAAREVAMDYTWSRNREVFARSYGLCD
jgi:glycosyltransferase involved in cell wall biosynthesis